jgi:hypothetical protein
LPIPRTVNAYLDFKPVIERHERAILARAQRGELLHGHNPIVARLSAIANAVNALKNLQSLTYDERIAQSNGSTDFGVECSRGMDTSRA